jgi:hypothetical protein
MSLSIIVNNSLFSEFALRTAIFWTSFTRVGVASRHDQIEMAAGAHPGQRPADRIAMGGSREDVYNF